MAAGWLQAKARMARLGPPQVEQAQQLLDMVFVTAEVAPWSKTGGLGDVMGSLPIALAKRGHRVMVVAPRCVSPAPCRNDLFPSMRNLQAF